MEEEEDKYYMVKANEKRSGGCKDVSKQRFGLGIYTAKEQDGQTRK